MADRAHRDPRQDGASKATRARRRIAATTERLGRLPLTAVFLGALALGLTALLWPGPVGGVLVLVVAALVAAMLTATWPRHSLSARAQRLLILGVLIVIAVTKFR